MLVERTIRTTKRHWQSRYMTWHAKENISIANIRSCQNMKYPFVFGAKFHFNLELFFTQVFAIAEDAAGWFLNCRYQSGLEWSRLKEGAASQSGSGRPTGNISTRSPHLLFFFFRRSNISVTISGGVGGVIVGFSRGGGDHGEQNLLFLILAFLPFGALQWPLYNSGAGKKNPLLTL